METNQMSFDPEAFMASVNTDSALSTITLAVPEGDYRAEVKSVAVQPPMISKKTGQLGSPICNVTWSILDEALKAQFERPEVTVRQSIFLDVDAAGNFETGKGKNAGLGRLREALGVNQPGNPFKNLEGRMALIKVKQRSDETNPEQKYSEVSKVVALPQ